jgi:protocatechuate 3,4-dioxygenase beta subunit
MKTIIIPSPNIYIPRRRFLHGLGLAGAALFTAPGLFAEQLALTPRVTEGPFYPDKMPLDTDNDLIILNDSITPALGEITHLSGRLLTAAGSPVRGAIVEIWQVDNQGIYLNTRDTNNGGKRDSNFQGYGRFLTDSSGAYYFRTIKPVPYPGRTPHIHFAVSKNGKRILTTQLLINGHPQNENDGVFKSAGDEAARKLLLADFKPLADSRIGELTANFDIILGVTPEDSHDDGHVHGNIGKSEMVGQVGGPGGPGGPPRGPGGPGFPGGPGGPRMPGGAPPPMPPAAPAK